MHDEPWLPRQTAIERFYLPSNWQTTSRECQIINHCREYAVLELINSSMIRRIIRRNLRSLGHESKQTMATTRLPIPSSYRHHINLRPLCGDRPSKIAAHPIFLAGGRTHLGGQDCRESCSETCSASDGHDLIRIPYLASTTSVRISSV